MMTTLETLNFDNLALRSLPIDPETDNYVRQVPGACFSKVKPTPVEDPETVIYSLPAMELLDLPEEQLRRPEFAEYFSGNKILPGSETASHCYCGHQFGNFAGQLGDGAAIYLGEVVNKKNERYEIQLKGAGLTPFSRSADGRKVLRSSIREFLCSEAMFHLGIPTTRAGSCVTSKSKVIRDIFYNGNPIEEQATIVLRLAQTFIRFGSFEISKDTDHRTGRKGPSVGRFDIIEQLLNYVIQNFYREIWSMHSSDKQKMYMEFYREVVKRTARLVAEWQCVGWCHGVLNTDNMSIIGVTIDYGPYGFLDSFDADFICNGSDDSGRYAYDKQPEICRWNCKKFAEAIHHFLPEELTDPVLVEYDEEYEKTYIKKMRLKLGLLRKQLPEDTELVSFLFETMQKTGADFTNTFRSLCDIVLPGSDNFKETLARVQERIVSQSCTVEELIMLCRPRMHPQQLQMFMVLMQTNPDILSQLGVNVNSVYRALEQLEKVDSLKNMTAEQKVVEDNNAWKTWLQKYITRLEQETVGSEGNVSEMNEERIRVMKENNPKFILRNYIAQNAITAAEKGDYTEVRRVLKLLQNPYSDQVDLDEKPHDSNQASASSDAGTSGAFVENYVNRPPEWSRELRVT